MYCKMKIDEKINVRYAHDENGEEIKVSIIIESIYIFANNFNHKLNLSL